MKWIVINGEYLVGLDTRHYTLTQIYDIAIRIYDSDKTTEPRCLEIVDGPPRHGTSK